MKFFLDQIEAKLQSFIEGASQASPLDENQLQLGRLLVQLLVGAMEQETSTDLIAPHHYYIMISPKNANYWASRQDLLTNLANSLQEAAVEQGVQFILPPVIHIDPDPNLDEDTVIVRTKKESIQPRVTDTAALPVGKVEFKSPDQASISTYLINEYGEAFPILGSTVSIGRNPDNDLVLDDPRTSRRHAQIIARHSRHILIDLDSTGGTFVNGQRITKQVLRPGDVIYLAGVSFVYYQEPADETGKILRNADQKGEG